MAEDNGVIEAVGHGMGAHGAGLAGLHGTDLWMAIAVVALPMAAALLVFLFGKRMWRGGALIPIAAIAGSLVLMLGFFLRMVRGGQPVGWDTDWFAVGDFHFTFGLLLDNLSVWLATLVSLLCLLIFTFSTHYLHEEPDHKLRRYYAVKSLFVAGMLGTVLMDNFLLMFMFWEVMGLCSYLLIGYWFERDSAAIAAKKAFLTTRLGDVFLFLGIVILLVMFQTVSYHDLWAQMSMDRMAMMGAGQKGTLAVAGLFIFLGAVGKSAQFPLDIWLPDAMEGPTTVSALIHAATMVKAGVYLVARSFPLYVALGLGQGEALFLLIGAVGGVTAIYTASMALAATDIKRVLAFSTLSQLGYMFLALGAGGYLYLHGEGGAGFTAAMLHLMNHAFFKALLFLGAGSVILGMHHHQDLREMGGLRKHMPVTFWTMLIASLSIAGIIPLSGFWSKDEVLASAFEAGHINPVFTVLWFLGVATAALTAFYMWRMMFLAFWGQPRSHHAEHAHESPAVMTIPLAVLAFFAFGSGLWLVTNLWGGFESLITYPYSHELGTHTALAPSDILHHILANPLTYLSLGVAVLGIAVAWRRYRAGVPASEVPDPQRGWRKLLYNRYYVTQLVYEPLGNYVAYGVARLSSWFDRRAVDGAVNGIAHAADNAGARTRRWQDGRLTTGMATVAIGLAVLLVAIYALHGGSA